MFLPQLNSIEPPWYGPVCPVVWEGWRREVSPYPDLGEGFRMPASRDLSSRTEGRLPKASQEGTRGG